MFGYIFIHYLFLCQPLHLGIATINWLTGLSCFSDFFSDANISGFFTLLASRLYRLKLRSYVSPLPWRHGEADLNKLKKTADGYDRPDEWRVVSFSRSWKWEFELLSTVVCSLTLASRARFKSDVIVHISNKQPWPKHKRFLDITIR